MSIDSFTKQSYESFPISTSFEADMEAGETISSQDIFAVDSEETDSTSIVLTAPVNDGAFTALVRVLAGTEALSPYKITFKIVTSLNNKWEYDVRMKIKEI